MARINRGKEIKVYKKTQFNFEDDPRIKQIRVANQKAIQILDARASNYSLIKQVFRYLWKVRNERIDRHQQ